MRRTNLILTTIVAALISISCGSETRSTKSSDQIVPALQNYEKHLGGAQILFDTYEHDFGNIEKGNKLKHTFYFINSGDAPLVVSNAKGSCGCTIPFFPDEPIQPGKQGQIDVEIDANNKKAGRRFSVTVRVESNAAAGNKVVKLKLSGTPLEEK